MPLSSTDDLIADLLDRVGSVARARVDRNALLGSHRAALVAACEGVDGACVAALDAIELGDGLRTASVDGAHACGVDRGEAHSVSVAMACDDRDGVRTSACLAPLPHMIGVEDVSAGLMMMQEAMLAVETAEADPDRLVLIDGSRLSTMIAIDQLYAILRRHRPGTLARWREGDAEPGALIRSFEGTDWLRRYLELPNVVGCTKLVTSRRLGPRVAAALGGAHPALAALVGDIDDKTLASVILSPPGPGDGEALGPIGLPPPRSPMRIASAVARPAPDHYPRAEEVDAALCRLGGNEGATGFSVAYLRPIAAHGAFSLEFNGGFAATRVADALRSGRGGDPARALLRGLAAFLRREVPAVDIQEPFLTHVADRRVKEATRIAGEVLATATRGDAGDLDWAMSRPHRT